MPFKVQVGPPQIAIHQGQTVLITEENGADRLSVREGPLFPRHPAGQRLVDLRRRHRRGCCSTAAPSPTTASRIFLTNADVPTQDGTIAARTLSLVISREADGGIHEDLDLTNHGLQPRRGSTWS